MMAPHDPADAAMMALVDKGLCPHKQDAWIVTRERCNNCLILNWIRIGCSCYNDYNFGNNIIIVAQNKSYCLDVS